MKKLSRLLINFFTQCPPRERGGCETISRKNSDCVRPRHHPGVCKDAWGDTWEKNEGL